MTHTTETDARPERNPTEDADERAELLAALKAASEWIDAQLFVRRTGIQERVRNAITRAEATKPAPDPDPAPVERREI
ncbi:unnamed protein product [Gemmata massiliana]|uniref:Uncharacterized protein n=1 Tax=Gemmata massiliana TaxID=1210884 RepID=A0A6P2DHD1_9BACT|nr:hypothetical protein [Gemmata massiliana]VTS00477.1 unnamed protein product [Gemmata massiliana]